MPDISHYFLVILNGLLLLGWLFAWWRSPSVRARQWQIRTLLVSALVAVLVQRWWHWPLEPLSFNADWLAAELFISWSLSLSLLAVVPRQVLKLAFHQAIRPHWVMLLASVLSAIVLQAIASNLAWPAEWVLSAALFSIGAVGVYLAADRLVTIKLQAVTAALSFGCLLAVGGVAAYLQPQLEGAHLGINWGFTLSTIILGTIFGWSWPILLNWWLRQTVIATARSR